MNKDFFISENSCVRLFILLMSLFVCLSACAVEQAKSDNRNSFSSPKNTVSNKEAESSKNQNVFDEFLKADFPAADGFDFPVGNADGKGGYVDKATGKRYDGWKISTQFLEKYDLGIHPAEDWNGTGGGDTDLGQDVFAVANGRVVYAENAGKLWGNIVIIEHIFYENNQKKKIRSLYAHLQEIRVKKGDDVRRRQAIATIGQDPEKSYLPHLHLELRWNAELPPTYWASSNGKDAAWIKENYASPSEFINSHRQLFVPQKEATLVLVDQASYKMHLYKSGNLQGEYNVSFGQAKGVKQVQGDNKTPVGMYFVIQKHRGKFDGAYGEYYGGHWIKINYPNKYDAQRGISEKIIGNQQASAIENAWKNRAATLQSTKLGGGIGFHGWIREWENTGSRHLSWGCVVMHIYDIRRLFDEIPEGTMVVIF